ncbi:MAG: hypothetical protein PWQ22_1592 [Archaeoglobaceae archaeon]|nr:hypothetical protein [Archaeoglobaceae archaeon]
MTTKATLIEQICGQDIKSEVEITTANGKSRIKLTSDCPKLPLFANKLTELEFDRMQVYNLGLYDLWLIARSCGLKPYCPVPTIILNAIWLENGMVAESLANKSITRIFLDPSKSSERKKTRIKIEQPLCGYVAFVKANSISPQKVEISIITPCSKIRQYLKKEVEGKPFRSFEDCERVIGEAKRITASCFIPVAVSIAYGIETKAIKVASKDRPILEMTFSKS